MSDKVEKLTAVFELERSTRRTIWFQEIGEPPFMGVAYIQKWALSKLGITAGQKVRITVERVEDDDE
jgi:hypothetical protein